MTKKEIAVNAVHALKKEYPDAICSLVYTDPLQLLIATRLAAQCTDARVNMVTPSLFDRFKTAQDFADSTPEEVAEYIKSCGLYKTKSKDIVEMARMLCDDFGGVVPDNIDDLTKLPGIGRKTANLVCGDIFGQPAVVVDTHCIRITKRLGLHDLKDQKKIEFALRELLPPDESNDFCHRLVLHGRAVCTARTTLADSDTLSKRTQTAIESAIKSGITVVAASGRPFVMMPDSVMNIVGLDYAITSNGAVISKCGKTVHRSLILPDDVLKILGAVRNDDVILEGFIDGFTYADVRYVHRPLDYGCEPEYFEYTRSCHGKIVDMRSFLSKHRNELDLISIISTDEKLRNRLWSSIEKACNSVEITTSTDHFVEIMSAEASKAKALLRLCDFLNIGMENVCACGNADNDADMIAESGLGAAVENASQKCLDRADIVIPSNNNDGVAQLIEKILKN